LGDPGSNLLPGGKDCGNSNRDWCTDAGSDDSISPPPAASWWLDAGIHIGDLVGQLGHASLSTTTRYVIVPQTIAVNPLDGPEWIRCYSAVS
jgi:hypothetical protein